MRKMFTSMSKTVHYCNFEFLSNYSLQLTNSSLNLHFIVHQFHPFSVIFKAGESQVNKSLTKLCVKTSTAMMKGTDNKSVDY